VHPDLSASIAAIAQCHRELPPPGRHEGDWHAELIGPAWLRLLARQSLGLLGFRNWIGKRLGQASGVNLANRNGATVEFRPFSLAIALSPVDGREALILRYETGAPFPVSRMRDEFRELDPQTLLGLSYTELPGAGRLGLPFMLRRATGKV
jgi:hypothetical protein